MNALGLTLRQKLFIEHLARTLGWDHRHLDNFIGKYFHKPGVGQLGRREGMKVIESLKHIQTHQTHSTGKENKDMAMTIQKMVEDLNLDLKKEYAAAIQYINHAAVMSGAAYGDIIKELKIHANEEIQHAVTLADQIDFLGGKPTVDVDKIYTADDNVGMLEQDLAGEEDAIARYKVRIEQAEELKEFALAQQLRTILAVEQEHAMDVRQALGK